MSAYAQNNPSPPPDHRILIAHSLGAISTVPQTLISLTPAGSLSKLKPSIELIHQHVLALGKLCGIPLPPITLVWPEDEALGLRRAARKRKTRDDSEETDSVCLSDHSDEPALETDQIKVLQTSKEPLRRRPTPMNVDFGRCRGTKCTPSARNPKENSLATQQQSTSHISAAQPMALRNVNWASSVLPDRSSLELPKEASRGRYVARNQQRTLRSPDGQVDMSKHSGQETRPSLPTSSPRLCVRHLSAAGTTKVDPRDYMRQPITASTEHIWPVVPCSPGPPISSPSQCVKSARFRLASTSSTSQSRSQQVTCETDLAPLTVGAAFRIDHPLFRYPGADGAQSQTGGQGERHSQ